MTGPHARRAGRRGVALAAVALGIALLAVIVVRLAGEAGSLRGDGDSVVAGSTVATTPPVSVASMESRPSPAGAAVAAARFFEAVLAPENVRAPERTVPTLRALATEHLIREWGTRYAEGLRDLGGRLSARGGDPVVRTAALGYRLEAYSPRRASVAVWKVSIVGTSASGVSVAFDTSRVILDWTPRGWRASGLVPDVAGPTPGVARTSQAETADAAALVPLIAGFRPYTR